MDNISDMEDPKLENNERREHTNSGVLTKQFNMHESSMRDSSETIFISHKFLC